MYTSIYMHAVISYRYPIRFHVEKNCDRRSKTLGENFEISQSSVDIRDWGKVETSVIDARIGKLQ